MNKKDLLQLFGLPDAFEGFVPVEGTKLWGWNGDRPIFPYLVREIKPSLIIEVGSWMGLSAVNMAKSCQLLGLETPVICIDTFLGSKEHWRDPELLKHMELSHGHPDFYKRFLTNVVQAKVEDRVIPLPMPSSVAASFLKDFKEIQADLIYVDGSHNEKDVYDDLIAYWDLVKPGGTILGDDWPWDSVSNAVKAFCSEVGVPYKVAEINWLIHKPVS